MLGVAVASRETKPGGTCLRCHLLRSIEVLSWTCFGLAALLLAQSNLGKTDPVQALCRLQGGKAWCVTRLYPLPLP